MYIYTYKMHNYAYDMKIERLWERRRLQGRGDKESNRIFVTWKKELGANKKGDGRWEGERGKRIRYKYTKTQMPSFHRLTLKQTFSPLSKQNLLKLENSLGVGMSPSSLVSLADYPCLCPDGFSYPTDLTYGPCTIYANREPREGEGQGGGEGTGGEEQRELLLLSSQGIYTHMHAHTQKIK